MSGLNLNDLPEPVRSLVPYLVGGVYPEAEPSLLATLSDELVECATAVTALNADGVSSVARLLASDAWQGAAHARFAAIWQGLGGEKGANPSIEQFVQLIAAAVAEESAALREHAVRMQYTRWMTWASLLVLAVTLVALMWNPAGWTMVQPRIMLTRLSLQQLQRQVLLAMVKFGAVSGAMDLGVQAAQMTPWGLRRPGEFDWASIGTSTVAGAAGGALFAGLGHAAARLPQQGLAALSQGVAGQAVLGGVSNAAAAVPLLALSGDLDGAHLLQALSSGVIGGIGPVGEHRSTDLAAAAPDALHRVVPDLGDLHPEGASPPGQAGPGGPAVLGAGRPAAGADSALGRSGPPGGGIAEGPTARSVRPDVGRPDGGGGSSAARPSAEVAAAGRRPGDVAEDGGRRWSQSGDDERTAADSASRSAAQPASESHQPAARDAGPAGRDPGAGAFDTTPSRSLTGDRPDGAGDRFTAARQTPPAGAGPPVADRLGTSADVPPLRSGGRTGDVTPATSPAGHPGHGPSPADSGAPGVRPERPATHPVAGGGPPPVLVRETPVPSAGQSPPLHAGQPAPHAGQPASLHAGEAGSRLGDRPPAVPAGRAAGPGPAGRADHAGPAVNRIEALINQPATTPAPWAGGTDTAPPATPTQADHRGGYHVPAAPAGDTGSSSVLRWMKKVFTGPGEGSEAAERSPYRGDVDGSAPAVTRPDGSDGRVPVRRILDDEQAARLRGRYANVITARETPVYPSAWADLPHWAVRSSDVPSMMASSDLTVRRFDVRGNDGVIRSVTEFTLTVTFADDFPPPRVMERAREAVDRYFNFQHRLPDGSQLHVRLEAAAGSGRPDALVEVRPGRGDRPDERANANLWFVDMPRSVYAHEIAHHLGFPDEYVEAGRHGHGSLTATRVRPDDSLMGSTRQWLQSGYLCDPLGRPVPALVSLRDRHIEDLFARAEEGGLGSGPRPAPHESTRPAIEPKDWRQPSRSGDFAPWQYADLRIRFPAGDRSPLEHILLLDQMTAVFDEVPRLRLKPGHLAYTESLLQAAGEIYDSPRLDLYHDGELRRLRRLAELWRMSAGGLAPDAETLRLRTGQVLGLPPGAVPETAQIDALARLLSLPSGRGTPAAGPVPGGDMVLHRRAAEYLGAPPSIETTRAAVRIIAEAAAADPGLLAVGGEPLGRTMTRMGDDYLVEAGHPPKVFERLIPDAADAAAIRVVADGAGRHVLQLLHKNRYMSDDFALGADPSRLSPSMNESELLAAADLPLLRQLPAAGFTRVLVGVFSTAQDAPLIELWRHHEGGQQVIAEVHDGRLAELYVERYRDSADGLLAGSRPLGAVPVMDSRDGSWAKGVSGLRLATPWMSYTLARISIGEPVHDVLIFDDIRPEDLGVDSGRPRTERTGFVVGGVNETGLVRSLDEISGRRLLPEDRELLARDNEVVRAAGLSHSDVAAPARALARLYEIGALEASRTHEIPFGGRRYLVSAEMVLRLPSAFDGELRDFAHITVEDPVTGQRLTISSRTAEEIARYGHYGDPEPGGEPPTAARVPPEDLIRLFRLAPAGG
ncbi:hypothetical protein Sru01_54900 [Sphaerisporangium rufum]|uniref:Outer membrane channel protein CpnT-like N-terminal domain-containing protein n=1 Tax=Sphaerisporangium rufum TaxID=1381558 RepID=A0A919R761_9ACTN|nr:hypothetical protein [Sphaerisporangium rufum]GII80508.1 hypothetical protein Sru01_54900 [Sphaerisporangium rufum]